MKLPLVCNKFWWIIWPLRMKWNLKDSSMLKSICYFLGLLFIICTFFLRVYYQVFVHWINYFKNKFATLFHIQMNLWSLTQLLGGELSFICMLWYIAICVGEYHIRLNHNNVYKMMDKYTWGKSSVQLFPFVFFTYIVRWWLIWKWPNHTKLLETFQWTFSSNDLGCMLIDYWKQFKWHHKVVS
jgi:hypothetical protein